MQAGPAHGLSGHDPAGRQGVTVVVGVPSDLQVPHARTPARCFATYAPPSWENPELLGCLRAPHEAVTGAVVAGDQAARSGTSAPSKSNVSMRTWSWNHSRWRRLGTAARAATCWCGAQWPDTSRPHRRGSRGDAEQLGDPAASGHVDLQAVDGARASPSRQK